MFEKFSEKARQTLRFGRNEAGRLGSPIIQSEHILMGILREPEKRVGEIFRRFQVEPEEILREIGGEEAVAEPIPPTADLPLSDDSKKILAYAAYEPEIMLHPAVEPEHLLIGLLRVEGCNAMQILARHGLDVDAVREVVIALHREAENG